MAVFYAPTSPNGANDGDEWINQSTGLKQVFQAGQWRPVHQRDMFAGVGPMFQNLKYVPVVGSNLPTGDNDLYTVPTGRSAYIQTNLVREYNPSGGSIDRYLEIKVGGTYYRIGSTPATLTTGTGATTTYANTGIVLNAGESLSINCATTAGLNVRLMAYEWDASDTRVSQARNLALASGNNTLLTVPAGYSAIGLSSAPIVARGSVYIVNATGGSLNYYLNVVPSGGSVGSANQLQPATAVGNGVATEFIMAATLAAGDVLNVNSSGADAGAHQIAWFAYYLLPNFP